MAKDFMKSNDVVEENFASPEYYEDRKSEALNYLNGLSGWVTVLYEPELGDITIYKDTSGLDTERDDIGPEEREGYMELSVDEVIEIINSDRVRVYTKENLDWRNKESQQVSEGAAWGESQFEGEFPKDDGARPDDDKFAALRLKFPDASEEELSNVYSAMQMKESKENKEEFETHKFEQKTIEEGGEDSVLYNLNENTVIVLDFLNEDEDMSAIVNNDTIANEEKMTKEIKLASINNELKIINESHKESPEEFLTNKIGGLRHYKEGRVDPDEVRNIVSVENFKEQEDVDDVWRAEFVVRVPKRNLNNNEEFIMDSFKEVSDYEMRGGESFTNSHAYDTKDMGDYYLVKVSASGGFNV
jgi:hypothetical protein